MSAPTFGPVDHDTASLLDLLAEGHPALPITADEWDWFLHILREAARETGVIDQNDVRPQLRDKVRPARIGAFYRRACLEGLIRADGWTESDDLAQRNRGKPMRRYRWLGIMPSGRTSPAAGTNSEAAVRKGSQSVASGKTPAPPSPSPRAGGVGQDSSDADAVGALASEGTSVGVRGGERHAR